MLFFQLSLEMWDYLGKYQMIEQKCQIIIININILLSFFKTKVVLLRKIVDIFDQIIFNIMILTFVRTK